jgi:hypothetical protein
MAAGYLDLQQRELRNAVVQPAGSVDALSSLPGVEGQIVSADGSLYIFASGGWRRLATDGDLRKTQTALGRAASSFEMLIPNGMAGYLDVRHGLPGRPLVQVTDVHGSVIDVEVQLDEVKRVARVIWNPPLPGGCRVLCVGGVPVVGT